MKPLLRLLSLLALGCAHAPAHAQSVPPLINYQGHLTDAQGQPLATADYVLTFSIHDAEIAGNAIWGPQTFDGGTANGHRPKVPVVGGSFNVLLGPEDAAGRSLTAAFNGTTRWIEIKIGSAPAIQPRQRILSAPFAIRSEFAETAKSAEIAQSIQGNALVTTPSGFVGIGKANPQYPLDIYGLTRDGDGSAVNITHEYSRAAGGTPEPDFIRAVNIWKNKYDIPADAIATGYQIGIAPEVYVSDSRFEGVIEQQFAIWARTGMHQIGAKGPRTINTAYGIYLQGLTAAGGTISNHFGVFQEGSGTKNFFGGTVGLGTSDPEARLHVRGVIMTEGAGAGGRIIIKSTAPGGHQYEWYPDSPANGDLGLYDRTHDRLNLVVKASGYVGIGTANPAHRFEVAGTTRLRGPVAGRDSSRGPTLTVEGTLEQSGSIVMDIIGPWDNTYQTDRYFLRGISSTGTRFSIRGDGQFFASSSGALKTNITSITNSVETLNRLRGVRFDWKEAPDAGPNTGFIAEEVANVLPEAVGNNGTMVNYSAVIPVLVEAVKELAAKANDRDHADPRAERERDHTATVSELRKALDQRDKRIEMLERRLGDLEAALDRISR